MEAFKKFLAKKDVVFTLQRYGIDALGAMAQGLFCTLLENFKKNLASVQETEVISTLMVLLR